MLLGTLRELAAPNIRLFTGYRPENLRPDLVAGLSVAAVQIPTAIAYAQLAGFPPIVGLYASILPSVVYALFGSSRQLMMGPDAATCAMVSATLVPLAGANPARYLQLSMALAVLVGVVCILAGLCGAGFIANFLSRPILNGFLNGTGLTIIAGQLGKIFGLQDGSVGFLPTPRGDCRETWTNPLAYSHFFVRSTLIEVSHKRTIELVRLTMRSVASKIDRHFRHFLQTALRDSRMRLQKRHSEHPIRSSRPQVTGFYSAKEAGCLSQSLCIGKAHFTS